MRRLLLAPLLALPLALSACGTLGDLAACEPGYQRPNIPALSEQLAAARARWKAANIQNYSYELTQFAAPVSLPAVRVTVQGGVVVKVEQLGPQDPLPGPEGRTMEQLFDDAATSISGVQNGLCSFITLSFDTTDGHLMREDGGTAARNVEDGFGSLVVSNFTRL